MNTEFFFAALNNIIVLWRSTCQVIFHTSSQLMTSSSLLEALKPLRLSSQSLPNQAPTYCSQDQAIQTMRRVQDCTT
jgi:hypothetical protein